ncbi:MAG: glycosyltransferase family 10 [Actinomycetota bacterium]|nr:glycosyltransferase family 10 [Actinomycetota bacterium]
MLKIKLSNIFPSEPILRQTPGGSGVWGNCKFYLNEPLIQCDYWIVHEGLTKRETCLCPPDKILFITGEPPDYKAYNKAFLSQFPKIITCHKMNAHPNVIHTQQGLPWHTGWRRSTNKGAMAYDDFKRMRPLRKDKIISVICSSEYRIPGHRKRLYFLDKLRNHFGQRLDVFGRGIRPVDDKWDAIAPYKYHIVLENSSVEHYWTEKLGDAYLGFAFPLYYGCPNINDYFNSKALQPIDIHNWRKSIQIIEDVINSSTYERSLQLITEARDAVLDKYNLFAMLADVISKDVPGDLAKRITLLPESGYRGRFAAAKQKITRLPGQIKYRLWLYKKTHSGVGGVAWNRWFPW